MRLKILALYSVIILNTNCMAQDFSNEKQQDVTLLNIQYVEDIKVYDNFIICLGFTFNEDGNGSYACLNKYDKNLNLIWTLKIDSTSTNQFDHIGIYEDRIFITGVHGIITNEKIDVTRFLYSISMEGSIISKVKIGKSVIPSTNIEYFDNSIWFAYTESNNTKFDPNSKNICVVVSYNLTTEKLTLIKGVINNAYPNKILKFNSNIFVLGNYSENYKDMNQDLFVMRIKNGQLNEKVVESNKYERFIDVQFTENGLKIYSKLISISDKKKYLNQTLINGELEVLTRKITSLSDLNISDINSVSYLDGEYLWILIEKEDSRSFLKFDVYGNPISEIKLKNIWCYSKPFPKPFIILDSKQIQVINRELLITNERPTPYMR